MPITRQGSLAGLGFTISLAALAAALACPPGAQAQTVSGGASNTQPCAQGAGGGLACGPSSTADDTGGAVAIGDQSQALGYRGTAVGSNSTASNQAAVAIGQGATASGTYSTALGSGAVASQNGAVAAGYSSEASGPFSLAFGWSSKALTNGAAAYGTFAVAGGLVSAAFGDDAGATGDYSVALGASASAAGTNSIAAGLRSSANGLGDIALGSGASTYISTTTNGNIAIGADSRTVDAASSPTYATATGGDAVGVGTAVQATGKYGVSLGAYSNVTGTGAAVGNVAIGYGSSDDGSNSRAVFSVGCSTGCGAVAPFTRAITNVSAGSVSSTSTDAVNGSQLYSVEQMIGSGGGGAYLPLAGGTMTGAINMGGNGITALQAGSVTATSTDAVNGAQLYATNQNVTTAQTTASNALAIADGALQTSGGAMTGAISMGGNGITALQAGSVTATSTDAVNGGQLYATNHNVMTAQTTASTALAIADGALQTTGGAMTGAISMSGNAITALQAGAVNATSTDAVNGSQLYSVEQMIGSGGSGAYLPLAGGTVTGAINMSGNGVTGLQAGSVTATSTDAVNGGQLYATNQNVTAAQTTASTALSVADGALQTAGGTMTGGLDMGGNVISSVGAGSISATSTEAVNGSQLYAAEQIFSTSGGSNPYFTTSFVSAPVPTASGANAIAVGGGSVASGASSIAMGDGALAENGAATSIGANNTASGDGAVAIGANNTATGAGSVAIGSASAAGAAGAVALGAGATAAQVDSVALGSGATTTRAAQVMLGGPGSSVTIGDIGASTAAQAGGAAVMTVDANGTVGEDTTIRPAIATLQSTSATQATQISSIQATDVAQNNRLSALETQTATLNSEMTQLQNNFSQFQRETRYGIADAMAMTAAPMPSAPGRTSWTVNVSEYHDAVGDGVSFAHRLNTSLPFMIDGGVSFSPSNVSARIGIGGEF